MKRKRDSITLRKSLLPSPKRIGKWEVYSFPLHESWLMDFRRYFRHDHDCVIDVMEVLKIITPEMAGMWRPSVVNRGVKAEEIQNYFATVAPEYRWRFQNYDITPSGHITRALDIFSILKNLKRGFAAFGGILRKGTFHHAIIIARDVNDEFWIIDPQMELITRVLSTNGEEYLMDLVNFFVLEYKK